MTSPTNEPNSGSSPSIIDKTPRDEPAKVTFENAWGELPDYELDGTVNLTGLTLHQVHGIGVAINGSADTWIVGVQNRETSSLLVYDQESWSQVAWEETFSQKVITFDHIFLPTQIYEANLKTIGDLMKASGVEESDVDLSDDVYTISVRSSTGLSMIRFNASTGELLSQTV